MRKKMESKTRRSPNKLKVKKRRGFERTYLLKKVSGINGMVESGSVVKLTLSQLRSLGKELQLRLPAKIKKEGLQLRIISELKWRENHSDVLRKTNEGGWDSLNRDRDGNVRIKKSTKKNKSFNL